MHACTCVHTYTYPLAAHVAHSHDQSTETQSSKALNNQFHPNSCATSLTHCGSKLVCFLAYGP